MKRFLTPRAMPILRWIVLSGALVCVQVCCTGRADAQHRSRAEAIAQTAAQFPNRDKSAEQIYDEGQIWHIAKIFVKQFRNLELGALTGPIEEDRIRTITTEVPGPVGSVTDSSTNNAPGQTPSGPGGAVSDTTSSAVVPLW